MVAVGTCLFAEPLLSNYCCIIAYFAVLAYQRVHISHCSLLKAIRPEKPTGVPPFLHFRGLCLWRLWSASPSFPVARFSRRLLSNCSLCSLLKAARPEWFPDKVWASAGVPPTSLFFSQVCALDVSSFISEGATPTQCPVTHFRSPVEDPTSRFSIFSSTVFLNILPDVPSFLRRGCRLAPLQFIPLLQSVSVRPSGAPLATLFLPGPWRPCPLPGAEMGRQVTCLRALTNFFRDPPSPWLRFFGFRRRFTTRRRSQYRSFSAPIVSTAAASLGISCRSTRVSVSSGFAPNP
jgi:hypothetical protein